MFENEYKMDIRRYQRWTTPIFYKVLSFWPWLFIFLLAYCGRDTYSIKTTCPCAGSP